MRDTARGAWLVGARVVRAVWRGHAEPCGAGAWRGTALTGGDDSAPRPARIVAAAIPTMCADADRHDRLPPRGRARPRARGIGRRARAARVRSSALVLDATRRGRRRARAVRAAAPGRRRDRGPRRRSRRCSTLEELREACKPLLLAPPARRRARRDGALPRRRLAGLRPARRPRRARRRARRARARRRTARALPPTGAAPTRPTCAAGACTTAA